MVAQDIDVTRFRPLLASYFNKDELKTLCFDLNIEYENLGGETKDGKVRELIKHCYRNGMLDKLLAQCQASRPLVEWKVAYQAEENKENSPDPDGRIYRFYQLTKEFNRNRHSPFTNQRTMEGDEIAFQMREMAPQMFGRFDVGHWLNNRSQGKRLAAVSYLSWAQDIEHFETLVERLFMERPFLQLHILLALNSMVDQLDYNYVQYLRAKLEELDAKGDEPIEYWQKRIMAVLLENRS